MVMMTCSEQPNACDCFPWWEDDRRRMRCVVLMNMYDEADEDDAGVSGYYEAIQGGETKGTDDEGNGDYSGFFAD